MCWGEEDNCIIARYLIEEHNRSVYDFQERNHIHNKAVWLIKVYNPDGLEGDNDTSESILDVKSKENIHMLTSNNNFLFQQTGGHVRCYV